MSDLTKHIGEPVLTVDPDAIDPKVPPEVVEGYRLHRRFHDGVEVERFYVQKTEAELAAEAEASRLAGLEAYGKLALQDWTKVTAEEKDELQKESLGAVLRLLEGV